MERKLKNGFIVELREMQKEDAQIVLDYMDLVLTESTNLLREKDEFNLTLEQEEKYLEDTFNSKDNYMVGCFHEGKLISVAGFNGRNLLRIKHSVSMGMSVLKEYYNLGVGSVVMEDIINTAISYEKKRLELEVKADNENAIKLYSKYGFVYEGRKHKAFFSNGKYIDLIVMGMMLNE